MTRDFHSAHSVRGRRPYYCVHCRTAILMSEQHVHVSGCSCGNFYGWRAHTSCHEAATGRPNQQGASEASGFHTPVSPGSTPGPASTFATGQQPERATVAGGLPHEHVQAPAARGVADSARNFYAHG